MEMTRMLRAGLLLVVTALGFTVVASAVVADGDDRNPPGQDIAQVQVIEPDLEQALSVLGEDRRPVDVLPGDIPDAVDRHPDFGMNPRLSRLAIGNATAAIYVIPGRGHACASLAIDRGATFACSSVEQLASGRSGAATAGLEEGVAIYGLVPDDVDSVSIHTGTGDAIVHKTQSNAYYAVVPNGVSPKTISYVGPSGRVEFMISDPRAGFQEEQLPQ